MHRFISLCFALLATATSTQILDLPESEGKVWDGDKVEIGYAPYMASLRSIKNVHFCGGTILSNRYILTSALCVYKRVPASITIIVGTLLRTDVTNLYRSSAILLHPGFNSETLQNDIALVLTATEIILTENIRLADIHPDIYVDNLTVSLSGWGIVSKDVYDPINLHNKNTTVISNEDCRMQLQRSGSAWRVTENKLCTAAVEHRGICYGDEGGALIFSYGVIGVASWHSYCTAGIPNIYERIAGHRLWIMSNLGISDN